ncbi:MAG: PhnD/SsuA/transferrin family substrate-binding protein, partial [Campylobacterota bacterium]|nr:PhnD/SsuA/transferrin family substrate-binding protein [Campylobacterota bacterium]
MKKLLFIFFILFLNSIFAKQECLQYGVIPYVSAQKIEQSYSNWKSFLEKKINRCIDINIQSNYADIINMFANDKLDFAFVGPFSYILTKQHSKVEPIVTGVTSDGY